MAHLGTSRMAWPRCADVTRMLGPHEQPRKQSCGCGEGQPARQGADSAEQLPSRKRRRPLRALFLKFQNRRWPRQQGRHGGVGGGCRGGSGRHQGKASSPAWEGGGVRVLRQQGAHEGPPTRQATARHTSRPRTGSRQTRKGTPPNCPYSPRLPAAGHGENTSTSRLLSAGTLTVITPASCPLQGTQQHAHPRQGDGSGLVGALPLASQPAHVGSPGCTHARVLGRHRVPAHRG